MPLAYDSPKAAGENQEATDSGKPIFAIMSSKNYSASSEEKFEKE